MSTDNVDNDDGLRSLDQLLSRDARLAYTPSPFGSGPMTQEDRYRLIQRYELHGDVPTDVRAHFDTARNLYLYAWFVVRFHLVAEQHAMASLEMALRKRLEAAAVIDEEGFCERILPPKKAGDPPRNRKERAMLKLLLTLAAEQRFLRNEWIQNRAAWAVFLARERESLERGQKMLEQGLDEMLAPATPAVPNEAELNFDWIGHFAATMPDVRNDHAHGNSAFYANVLWTFEVVQDLVQQLFPRKS